MNIYLLCFVIAVVVVLAVIYFYNFIVTFHERVAEYENQAYNCNNIDGLIKLRAEIINYAKENCFSVKMSQGPRLLIFYIDGKLSVLNKQK